MKNVIICLLAVFLLGCNNYPTTFLDIKFEDIDKIALHWKEHPYHNPSPDYIEIDEKHLQPFIEDFNSLTRDSKEELENRCYELLIYYIDGTVDRYDFDGHRVIVQKNKHHYTCVDKENLITKYWGITEKDFCVGTE